MELKHLIIAIALLAAAGAIYFAVGRPHRFPANPVQAGPIRHGKLNDSLIERIRAFEPVLAEVYPMSHEKWLEGFQRDVHPESEIAIWESIAGAWRQLPALGPLTPEERKEAFGILLVRSSTEDVASTFASLKHLPRDKAAKLLGYYTAPPQPVTVAPTSR